MTNKSTEHELIDAAAAIGRIPEMAAWATAELAAMIEQTGKSVGDLTIAELVALDRAHTERVKQFAINDQLVDSVFLRQQAD